MLCMGTKRYIDLRTHMGGVHRYTCVYICIHICMCKHMHKVHMYIFICIYIYIYLFRYVHIYTWRYIYIHIWVYIFNCLFLIYTYIHLDMGMYT